ncbi:MAG: hypothetical protein V3R64_02370 [Sphingomonadales bacterium]
MKKGLAFITGFTILAVSACSSGPGVDYFTVSEDDLEILQETRLLLAEESQWARNEETQCDLEAEAFTLFCALQKASFDVAEDFMLRRPALEEVRYAIDEISPELDRRLLDFNNLETTDLAKIHLVIDMALERLQVRLGTQ